MARSKHMTPAQKRKRKHIAESIHRDNPDMPMSEKFAIATDEAMGRPLRHGKRKKRSKR